MSSAPETFRHWLDAHKGLVVGDLRKVALKRLLKEFDAPNINNLTRGEQRAVANALGVSWPDTVEDDLATAVAGSMDPEQTSALIQIDDKIYQVRNAPLWLTFDEAELPRGIYSTLAEAKACIDRLCNELEAPKDVETPEFRLVWPDVFPSGLKPSGPQRWVLSGLDTATLSDMYPPNESAFTKTDSAETEKSSDPDPATCDCMLCQIRREFLSPGQCGNTWSGRWDAKEPKPYNPPKADKFPIEKLREAMTANPPWSGDPFDLALKRVSRFAPNWMFVQYPKQAGKTDRAVRASQAFAAAYGTPEGVEANAADYIKPDTHYISEDNAELLGLTVPDSIDIKRIDGIDFLDIADLIKAKQQEST